MFENRERKLQDPNIMGSNRELYDKQNEVRTLINDLINKGSKVLKNNADKAEFLNARTELQNFLKGYGLNGTIDDYIEVLYDDFGLLSYYWDIEERVQN